MKSSDSMISIALPKGRLGEKVFAELEQIGYACPEMHDEGRKLIFENAESGVRYFWAKPSDVAIYVEHGAADVGIVGYDIIANSRPDVYELLDLGIGKCRMCVAGPAGSRPEEDRPVRAATKFTRIAKEYYASIGRECEIIKLSGSIEIAPILGLSDVIVDIVETGKTLVENGLEVYEPIMDISARLIANKAAYKFKSAEITKMVSLLADLAANEKR